MDSRQAFTILLAQVETALQESLARSNTATQRGEFDTMELEIERQRNLVSARNQLQGLQELWTELVGKQQQRPPQKPKRPKERSPRRRLPKGAKTPGKAFVFPILTVLEEMGGQGAMTEVLNRVGSLFSGILNEFDRSKLKNGQLRWHNTAQWARLDMKEAGFLASDSPRGVWKITESGRALLHEQRKRLEKQGAPSLTGASTQGGISNEGYSIFTHYKGRRYEAILLPNRRVLWDGQEYSSPSSAASAVAGGSSVNGWRFWRYVDKKGREQPIHALSTANRKFVPNSIDVILRPKAEESRLTGQERDPSPSASPEGTLVAG